MHSQQAGSNATSMQSVQSALPLTFERLGVEESSSTEQGGADEEERGSDVNCEWASLRFSSLASAAADIAPRRHVTHSRSWNLRRADIFFQRERRRERGARKEGTKWHANRARRLRPRALDSPSETAFGFDGGTEARARNSPSSSSRQRSTPGVDSSLCSAALPSSQEARASTTAVGRHHVS